MKRIGIVGCGAIGSLYAAHLAQVAEVHVLVRREEQARALNQHGLRVSGTHQFSVKLKATTDPGQLPECDLGIVATKATQTAEAIAPAGQRFDKDRQRGDRRPLPRKAGAAKAAEDDPAIKKRQPPVQQARQRWYAQVELWIWFGLLRSPPAGQCMDRGDSGRVFGDMVDASYRHFWHVGEGGDAVVGEVDHLCSGTSS